jgi:hypothetical protein
MNKLLAVTLGAFAAATLCAPASAQQVIGPIITSYRPITEQEPTVTYSPMTESATTTTNYGPVVTYSPVTPPATTAYYQGPYTVSRPIVQPATTYAPVASAPVVTYYPATPAYVAPAPVVTYRPVAPAYYAAPAPVITYRQPVTAYAPSLPYYGATTYSTYPAVPTVVARPVIVSPKVYYPGQPVRNVLRAITP